MSQSMWTHTHVNNDGQRLVIIIITPMSTMTRVRYLLDNQMFWTADDVSPKRFGLFLKPIKPVASFSFLCLVRIIYLHTICLRWPHNCITRPFGYLLSHHPLRFVLLVHNFEETCQKPKPKMTTNATTKKPKLVEQYFNKNNPFEHEFTIKTKECSKSA